MRTSASTPTVTHNDHMAAAAYVMKHAGATALVVVDGQRPGRPVGIITKADLISDWERTAMLVRLGAGAGAPARRFREASTRSPNMALAVGPPPAPRP